MEVQWKIKISGQFILRFTYPFNNNAWFVLNSKRFFSSTPRKRASTFGDFGEAAGVGGGGSKPAVDASGGWTIFFLCFHTNERNSMSRWILCRWKFWYPTRRRAWSSGKPERTSSSWKRTAAVLCRYRKRPRTPLSKNGASRSQVNIVYPINRVDPSMFHVSSAVTMYFSVRCTLQVTWRETKKCACAY